MLNLKKGLALVLAAATAFTFAPVANLGSVVAQAASSDVTTVPAETELPSEAYTQGGTGSKALTSASKSGEIGWDDAKLNKYFSGLEIDNLQVQTQKPNAIFRLAGDLPTGLITKDPTTDEYTSYQNKGGTETRPTGQSTAWSTSEPTHNQDWSSVTFAGTTYMQNHAYAKADSNGILTIGKVYITTSGDHKFNLVQCGATGLEIIEVNVKAPARTKLTYPAYDLYNATTTGSGANIHADVSTTKLEPQGKTYTFKLNENKPGYAIKYASSPKYTDWAGNEHDVKTIKLNATNSSLQWVNGSYDDAISTNAVSNGLVKGTDYKDAEWTYRKGAEFDIDVSAVTNIAAIFKTTASTFTTDSIDAEYVSAEGSSKSTVDFATDRSDAAIDDIYDTVEDNSHKLSGTGTESDPYVLGTKDRYINNEGKLIVKTESPSLYFRAEDPSIIQINETTGEYKVLNKGDTRIIVFTAQTLNNNAKAKFIKVHVDAFATDQITVDDSKSANALYTTTADNDTLDMDIPTQKAAQAVITDKIDATSKGGLTVLWKSDHPENVKVDEKTGEVTAVAAGTATLTAYTKDDLTKEIYGTEKKINVTVWTLPASVFTFDDVTVEVNKEVSLFDKTHVTEPDKNFSIKYDYAKNDSSTYYSLTNVLVNSSNTQSTSKLTGKKIGTSKVQATVLGISGKYRPTTHVANVTVLDKSLVPTITLDDASKSLNLNVGDTAQLKGTVSNGKTVEFSTKDTTVVSVTSGGAITALAAGKATVVASADGADSVEIPVLVSDNNNAVQPAAVTGLKVSNKKGAYVSVKWASQGKNINYRIWKKVGNGKWIGKNVAGSKTTLSVKKGAKVQVKVKAYVKDSTGKTTWGPKATKAKTFKTDKK